MTAKIVSVTNINAVAHGIGEISGPAVSVAVSIDNESAKAIDLGNVVVNLQDAAGTPADTISGSPAKALSGMLASKAKANGVYVFTLSTHKNPVTISFSYSVDAPVVLFVGDVK